MAGRAFGQLQIHFHFLFSSILYLFYRTVLYIDHSFHLCLYVYVSNNWTFLRYKLLAIHQRSSSQKLLFFSLSIFCRWTYFYIRSFTCHWGITNILPWEVIVICDIYRTWSIITSISTWECIHLYVQNSYVNVPIEKEQQEYTALVFHT